MRHEMDVIFGLNVGRLTPNGTNLELFHIRFGTFWLTIWGQSDLRWAISGYSRDDKDDICLTSSLLI